MNDLIEELWKDILVGLLTFLIGYFWGQWKGIKDWNNKKFKNRINVSLNTVTSLNKDKYKLQIRTLVEKNINCIILNKKVRNIIEKSIKNAKPGKPLLIFEQQDAWYILNTILNQIVYQFSNGTLKKDLGLQVTSEWYTFCLTFEKEENIKMQKIRVILIKRKILENFPDENSQFILESFNHETRVQTLRILKKELKEHPYCFMDVELCQ